MSGAYPNPSGAPAGPILAGGNRMDFLVQAPATVPSTNPVQFVTNGGNVFQVQITGTKVDMKDPKTIDWPQMPDYLTDLPQPTDYPHQVTFGWDAEPGRATVGGGRVTSNVGLNLPAPTRSTTGSSRQYGPLIDQCMPLNALTGIGCLSMRRP